MKTAEEIGTRSLEMLRRQASNKKAAGAIPLEEARRIVVGHAGPNRLTARQVRARMCEPKRSLRRVQDYLKIIRAESSVQRDNEQ